ncbi:MULTISPECIES: hypothetical protein [Sorangium]|uniref:Uncharacterized protein n=1 Tax=Sorangium cellulosum TaxID=56 RepID=A0A4P2QYI7_SORCE|nr:MULTISPECIES: hypothetical protein [Sorangium]AUX35650.1 uncharacterized protein SOCE836_078450 [Sorangium cellulosum]WCQ94950.1 hypothetical protein NQZ70_07723 [Sorangium sp. Soce836]
MSAVALGVAAESAGDVRIVQTLRGELHFDPCTKPEQLTSKNEADRKDAKRVLGVLTSTGRDALARWADVPLERLEAHGGACGLARFVREVRERLVPLVERG